MALESPAIEPTIRVTARRYTFQFEIDYSKSKDLPAEDCITSPVFSAGGYDWRLQYFPQGIGREYQGSHASIFLVLMSDVTNVTAEVSFEVLANCGKFLTIFHSGIHNFEDYEDICGEDKCISRDQMKDNFCKNGILVITCSIRVLTEPNTVENFSDELCKHLQNFRERGEGCDVTFEVEGKSISAHRVILAARSPVFYAQLCGPLAETKLKQIKVEEMKAEVFKALLDFIYTDDIVLYESTNNARDDDVLSVELIQPLLAAADRYGIDKLTLLCEEVLERSLSVDTVASTLILADRHSRTSLKSKCLEFASDLENFSLMALTEGFSHITSTPTLFAELSEKIKSSCHRAKKRRIT